MSVIHRGTTLVPSKLELLTQWLPAQPWYVRQAGGPRLEKAGGFRLDDPAGEVGIEFMVVLDQVGGDATAYLAPMTYRGTELPGGQAALIGTSEHGALGHRWCYDGTRDPVLLAALTDFIQGRALAQDQNLSDTLDPTVLTSPVPAADGERLEIEFARVLTPVDDGTVPQPGEVTAVWTGPGGGEVRGVFATARPAVTRRD